MYIRKIIEFLGVYLVGKDNFLSFYDLWEDFEIFGYWTSQTMHDPKVLVKLEIETLNDACRVGNISLRISIWQRFWDIFYGIIPKN